VHRERLDAQAEGPSASRRRPHLGHGDAEVARAVAHARQAHAHADAFDPRIGHPAQLVEAVDDHQGAVGRRAREQALRLGRPVDDDRAPVGIRHCAGQPVLGLAGDLMPGAPLTQRAQDRRHAVGLVGIRDAHVGPLGAPRGGKRPVAIAHDVQVRQPQRRTVLGEQVGNAHLPDNRLYRRGGEPDRRLGVVHTPEHVPTR
jgi:hypothetical protein